MTASNIKTAELLAPIFLEFGKSVYICQCFESSLCFLLSLVAHDSAEQADGAFQASWDFHSKKTLGGLLKALREQIDVPEELDAFFGEGVDKRNELIHGFLTQKAQRLANPKERLAIEHELVVLKEEVKRRDVVVNKLIDALLHKYGTSNEHLKRNADRLWERQNNEPPEHGIH